MGIRYEDTFVIRLFEEICALIAGNASDASAIASMLDEITKANIPSVDRYRQRVGPDVGVPDSAFRSGPLFHFPDAPVARTFRTSGTSGLARGTAAYSERGLELMRRSIVANARRHVFDGLSRPSVIRLVPDSDAVPDGIMPYGMRLLADTFGEPATSASVIGAKGIDLPALTTLLDRAVADERPVVLVGGSFAFVHLCDAMTAQGRRWELPAGSRMVDAGGFKGRSRELDVDALRASVGDVFGISRAHCNNIFGMTELASQLYDAADVPVGPKGERPKAPMPFVAARVRDPLSWSVASSGPGLLEVVDLCVLDRPHVVLTGDWAVAADAGVAIAGRVLASESRGCALSFESREAALEGAAS